VCDQNVHVCHKKSSLLVHATLTILQPPSNKANAGHALQLLTGLVYHGKRQTQASTLAEIPQALISQVWSNGFLGIETYLWSRVEHATSVRSEHLRPGSFCCIEPFGGITSHAIHNAIYINWLSLSSASSLQVAESTNFSRLCAQLHRFAIAIRYLVQLRL